MCSVFRCMLRISLGHDYNKFIYPITSASDSVSVDASSFSFKYYHGGTYVDESCSNKKLNHAMLLVGYGSSGEQDYWIVKNRSHNLITQMHMCMWIIHMQVHGHT